MPSTPYAKLLVSLNGGATSSGGIVTTLGVSVQLSAEDTAFWTSQRFEINDYPPGFPCPSGWSVDPNTLAYYWSLTSTPPPFTIPAALAGGLWGKYMFWLTVNGGLLDGAMSVQLLDKSTALSIQGPGGTLDCAFSETNQFDPVHQWNGALKADLRVLDGLSYAVSVLGNPSIDPIPLLVSQRDNTGQLRGTSFATASTLVADAGALRLQAGPQVAVAMLGVSAAAVALLGASSAHVLQLGDGNEITTVDFAGESVVDVGAAFTFAFGDVGPTISQAPMPGTGSANGQPMTFTAQPGQTETGGADNTLGGNIVFNAGAPGTGGGGAPGTQGLFYFNGSGAQFPFAVSLADPGAAGNAVYGVTAPSGVGSRNGITTFFNGQPGQQTGGSNNNDGGDVEVNGGFPGTGGSGGNQGKASISGLEFHLNQGGINDVIKGTSAGLTLGTSTSKVGLFGASPVTQPNSTGDTTQTSAGSGSPVLVDSTTTGGIGTTAYTTSDAIKALKQLGALAM